MANTTAVRESILSRPTAVGQLGGYYSGGSSQVRNTGLASVNGQTVSLVDRQVPFFALSPAFAEKASKAGVSVSFNSQLGATVVTPNVGLPVYSFDKQGNSQGWTGARAPVDHPEQSTILSGQGGAGMSALLPVILLLAVMS